MPELKETFHLKDFWNDERARELAGDPLGLLRYRSNLLGADLRITNFGGGNTSSKIDLPDPFSGKLVRVLAVKGSGGDLGSIKESGFALLHLERLEQLKQLYRGEAYEDEMVRYYPLAAFGENRVAASIDTPLHAFLPFPHVDHLHPDWAIALAASANGKRKLEVFNRSFGRKIVWLPWQRPVTGRWTCEPGAVIAYFQCLATMTPSTVAWSLSAPEGSNVRSSTHHGHSSVISTSPSQNLTVLSENHIRTYWWCNPDKIGMATMTPDRWTARPRGTSLPKAKCVRTCL